MKIIGKYIVFLSMVLTCTSMIETEKGNGFEEVYKRNGVTLAERWIENQPGVKFREVRAILTVQVSLESVIKLLRDQEKGLEWNTNASNFKVWNQSSKQWETYIRYDFPWPLNDHESYLGHYIEESQDVSAAIIRFNSLPGKPISKDALPIEDVQGKWELTSEETSLTRITYTVTSKPSNLPRMVTDPIVRYNLTESLSLLKNKLETTNNGK